MPSKVGKYEIIRGLRKGALGSEYYLARDTISNREVTFKTLAHDQASDPERRIRFEREAKVLAKMTHPNVAQVFDLGNHTDGSPYIAMEPLKGQDLYEALRQTPMTLARKVGIILQVLKGLSHVHRCGIVHRDIKPANIFMREDGSVMLIGFDVANVTAASMTGTGTVVGSPAYMSPEQVRGERVDRRSDLFSVGCMMCELASGSRPFHSDKVMEIFHKTVHEDPNFDMIPQGYDCDTLLPILRRALAKDLAERYQTAEEFAADLREWLRAHATSAELVN
jgi:serine/threonine-protein kinase